MHVCIYVCVSVSTCMCGNQSFVHSCLSLETEPLTRQRLPILLSWLPDELARLSLACIRVPSAFLCGSGSANSVPQVCAFVLAHIQIDYVFCCSAPLVSANKFIFIILDYAHACVSVWEHVRRNKCRHVVGQRGRFLLGLESQAVGSC